MRAFIALIPPADPQQRLGDIQQTLAKVIGGRGDPNPFHVTLRFFKKLEKREMDRVAANLGRIAFIAAPFQVGVSRIAEFPKKGAGLVVAELVKSAGLMQLHSWVSNEGKRPFRPHMTLLRDVARRVPIDFEHALDGVGWEAHKIAIIESQPEAGGFRHIVRETYELTGKKTGSVARGAD